MCRLLVGLGDNVVVLGVDDEADGPLVVLVETVVAGPPVCAGCGTTAELKDRAWSTHVDLPVFGRSSRLRWRKRRWRCVSDACRVGSWTETNPQIAASRQVMTRRAGQWATIQVGQRGRTVSEVANELGCDWHTVNDTVTAWGDALLAADVERIGTTEAVGLDETLFARQGRYRTQQWCTSIVDVKRAKLLDIVSGRDAAGAVAWLQARGADWLAQVRRPERPFWSTSGGR